MKSIEGWYLKFEDGNLIVDPQSYFHDGLKFEERFREKYKDFVTKVFKNNGESYLIGIPANETDSQIKTGIFVFGTNQVGENLHIRSIKAEDHNNILLIVENYLNAKIMNYTNAD